MDHFLYRRIKTGIYLIIIILFVGGISSCTPSRKLIKEPLRQYGTEYLIEQIKAQEIKSEYFTARFSANFTRNRENMSFSGQIRIKKDSIIWLTLSPALGMEMGRLILTNDSVKWMNRLEYNFMLTETEQLAGMIHPLLEYNLLQSLILGNYPALCDKTQFKGSIDNREYKLSMIQRRSLKTIPKQQIWLNPNTFRITKVSIRDFQRKDTRIDVEYDRFVEANGLVFALRQQYNIEGGGNKININISFSRLNTTENSSFPFTIPEKYVSIKDLVSL